MPAYLAIPRSGRGAGVVVLQEIFGLSQNMKSVCDWLAMRQFTALCPDLYWRTSPGVKLDESMFEEARAARAKADDNQVSDDAAAAADFLRKHEACTGRVGVVGYCWGGLLAYLTATRHKPDAAVSYYGVGIDKRLEVAKNLACPMLMHFAELDKFAPPEAVAQIRNAFNGNARVTIYTYPDTDHAFARQGGHNFKERPADLANMRTLSFLVEKLIGNR
jgi:carboxymethylenebutenolidase